MEYRETMTAKKGKGYRCHRRMPALCIAAALCMAVLPVSGCGRQGDSPDAAREEVLDYLEGLYDDKFQIRSVETANWAYSYDLLTVASEKYGGRTFQARRYLEDRSHRLTDNYFSLTMEADAGKFMRGLAEEAGLEAEVSVEFTEGERPEGLDAAAVFQDYLDMGGSPFCYVTLAAESGMGMDEKKAFLRLLVAEGFQCNAVFRQGTQASRYRICRDGSIQEYE